MTRVCRVILLTLEADATFFALFACAATVIEIATDLIAWDGCSRCVPRGGSDGLVWTRLEAQKYISTWILAPLGHGIDMAFEDTRDHESIVEFAERVKCVNETLLMSSLSVSSS